MSPSELGERLLNTFLAEMDHQLRAITEALLALEAAPEDRERLTAVYRSVHTIKGAAGAAGVGAVERIAHTLESSIERVRRGEARLAAEDLSGLFAAIDQMTAVTRELRLARMALPVPEPAPEFAPARPAARAALLSSAAPGSGSDAPVRVLPDRLDALLAFSTQLQTLAGHVGGRAGELDRLRLLGRRQLRATRRQLGQVVAALQRAGTGGELEASLRAAAEEWRGAVAQLAQIVPRAREDAHRLEVLAGGLAEQVNELRMQPFAEICEGLPRAVRDLARATGKEVRLELYGQDVTADRGVLDAFRDAVLPLVRNAVDHGIEPPERRIEAGKPRQGTLRVGAERSGDRIVVSVTDDGPGLDSAAIRAKLEERGIAAPEEPAALAHALFEAGFSTRREATEISGRGMGLDIVREVMSGVHGNIRISWEPGVGTRIVLECPPVLSALHALFVRAGGQTFAIPVVQVETILRLHPHEVRTADGVRLVMTAGGPVPLVSLSQLLGGAPGAPAPEGVPVVLLGAAGSRLGVVVDEWVATQAITVQPLPYGGNAHPFLSGAAVYGAGRIAYVLDASRLVMAGRARGAEGSLPEGVAPAPEEVARVLVVDDSITTRTLEQSILEAAGYRVTTAVDGAEAWRLLQEQRFDLVVSDIEMPRMDGFALCEAIRAAPRLRQLPVVLVSALESTEHRLRGLEAGADAYLGKSSFEQQMLLDAVAALLRSP